MFLLCHLHDRGNGEADDKLIGVYSREGEADVIRLRMGTSSLWAWQRLSVPIGVQPPRRITDQEARRTFRRRNLHRMLLDNRSRADLSPRNWPKVSWKILL